MSDPASSCPPGPCFFMVRLGQEWETLPFGRPFLDWSGPLCFLPSANAYWNTLPSRHFGLRYCASLAALSLSPESLAGPDPGRVASLYFPLGTWAGIGGHSRDWGDIAQTGSSVHSDRRLWLLLYPGAHSPAGGPQERRNLGCPGFPRGSLSTARP